MALFRRKSEPEPEQTDSEFVAACGYADDAKAAEFAVKLRRKLADLAGIRHVALVASTRFVDTGVFDPNDSLDLLDFTLHLEKLFGQSVDQAKIARTLVPDAFELGKDKPTKQVTIESMPEFLTVAEWTRRLVALAREHGAI